MKQYIHYYCSFLQITKSKDRNFFGTLQLKQKKNTILNTNPRNSKTKLEWFIPKMKKHRSKDRHKGKKRTSIAVGDVNGAFEGASKKNSDDALAGVLGDPVVVVDDAQKNQRVNYHLLDRSS